MSNREPPIDLDLLRSAAAAAGHKVERVGDDGDSLVLVGAQEPWRPHRDEAQSHALAMACDIRVTLSYCYERDIGSLLSATRRAIVTRSAGCGLAGRKQGPGA